MMRERALEEALAKAANELSYAATCLYDAEWSNAAAHCERASNAAAALASAQQEPAAAADAVTDEMVQAANREYWKNRQGPKISEDRKQFERDKMRRACEAAARAKSGEKGGADV